MTVVEHQYLDRSGQNPTVSEIRTGKKEADGSELATAKEST